MTKKIEIGVYGHIYRVEIPDDMDENYVKFVARYVDEKMVDVAQQIGHEDTMKVAIFTLLNLADENIQLKQKERNFNQLLERVKMKIIKIDV